MLRQRAPGFGVRIGFCHAAHSIAATASRRTPYSERSLGRAGSASVCATQDAGRKRLPDEAITVGSLNAAFAAAPRAARCDIAAVRRSSRGRLVRLDRHWLRSIGFTLCSGRPDRRRGSAPMDIRAVIAGHLRGGVRVLLPAVPRRRAFRHNCRQFSGDLRLPVRGLRGTQFPRGAASLRPGRSCHAGPWFPGRLHHAPPAGVCTRSFMPAAFAKLEQSAAVLISLLLWRNGCRRSLLRAPTPRLGPSEQGIALLAAMAVITLPGRHRGARRSSSGRSIDIAMVFEGVAARLDRLVRPIMAFPTFYALLVVVFACLYRIAESHRAGAANCLHGSRRPASASSIRSDTASPPSPPWASATSRRRRCWGRALTGMQVVSGI